MIIKIFKTNQLIANIFIVLLSVLLWIPGYFSSVDLSFENHSVFNLFGKLMINYRGFNVFFTSFLIGLQAIFLNYILNQEKLLKGNTHLVGLFYVVLNGAIPILFSINPAIVSNVFIITTLFLFLKLYSFKNAGSLLFNTGLLLGISVLFYAPLFCLFPLIWIVLSYVRTPNFRDFFISLLGFLLPFIYLFVYLYLNNRLYESNIIDWIYFPSYITAKVLQQPFIYFLIIVFGFIAISFFSLLTQLSRDVIKDRKLFIVLILLSIFLTATLFFNDKDYNSLYILLTIPFSAILANYFYKLKKEWLAEIFFTIILLGILGSYFL